ncbi:hypothetical protein ACQ4PT_045214 [Festuca glaucescens]
MLARFHLSSPKGNAPPGDVDIELGLQGGTPSSAQPGFDGFFEQVREIEKLLATLTELLGALQVVDILQEIQERHDAVKEIETKILELQQIFLDLSILVETQGEMVNNIEEQAKVAAKYVEDGRNLLEKAKTLQKNTREWTCIAIIILLITILVVVLSLKPWAKE